MKIKLKNRIVSALLALSMVASFLPGNMIPVVYAADCIDSAEVTLNPDGTFSVKLDGLNGATDTGNYHYALVPNVGVNSGYTLSDRLNNPTLVGGGFDPVDYSTLVSRLAAVGATNSTGYISNNLPGRVFTQEEKTSPPSGSFSITKAGNDNNGDPLTLPSFTDVRNALVAFAANGNRTLYFKDAEGNEKAVTYDKVVELVEIPYVFIFWGGADSIKAKYTVAHASYGAGGLLVNGPIVVNYQIGVKNDYSDYTWTPGEEVDGTFTPKPEWTGASFADGDGGYPGIKYSINNGTGEDVTFNTEGCSFGGLASGLTFYTPNGDLVGAEINIPAGETYDLEIQFDSGDLAGTPTGKGTITIPWTGSGEAADNLVLEFELKTTTSSWEPENIDFTIRDTYDMTDLDWQATYVTLNSPYAKLIYHGPSVEFDPDACKTIAGAGGLAGSTITYWNTDSSGNATTEITSPITISEGKTIKMHVTPVAGVTYPGVIASVLGPKVTVTAGTATADVSITMRITRDERYTVTGKVASGEESRGTVSLVHNNDAATEVETTDTNGTVSIGELLAHSADKPSVVTVTATAKDGYRFNGWSIVKGTNTTSSSVNPANENVTANVTYTATFVANKVTVTVKENTDNDTKGKQVRLVNTRTNTVFGTAPTSTANNGVLEFSEVPNDTYAVETSLDGTTWTKVTEVTVDDNDQTATVQYYTVTARKGTGANTVSVNSVATGSSDTFVTQAVLAGASATLAATPTTTYADDIATWAYTTGTGSTSGNSFSITNIQNEIDATASYSNYTGTITVHLNGQPYTAFAGAIYVGTVAADKGTDGSTWTYSTNEENPSVFATIDPLNTDATGARANTGLKVSVSGTDVTVDYYTVTTQTVSSGTPSVSHAKVDNWTVNGRTSTDILSGQTATLDAEPNYAAGYGGAGGWTLSDGSTSTLSTTADDDATITVNDQVTATVDYTANSITINIHKNHGTNLDMANSREVELKIGTTVVATGITGSNGTVTFTPVQANNNKNETTYSIFVDGVDTGANHVVTCAPGGTKTHDLYYYDVQFADISDGNNNGHYVGTKPGDTEVLAGGPNNKVTLPQVKEASGNYEYNTWGDDPDAGAFTGESAAGGTWTINDTYKDVGPIVLTPTFKRNSNYTGTIIVRHNDDLKENYVVELWRADGTEAEEKLYTDDKGVATKDGLNGSYIVKVNGGTVDTTTFINGSNTLTSDTRMELDFYDVTVSSGTGALAGATVANGTDSSTSKLVFQKNVTANFSASPDLANGYSGTATWNRSVKGSTADTVSGNTPSFGITNVTAMEATFAPYTPRPHPVDLTTNYGSTVNHTAATIPTMNTGYTAGLTVTLNAADVAAAAAMGLTVTANANGTITVTGRPHVVTTAPVTVRFTVEADGNNETADSSFTITVGKFQSTITAKATSDDHYENDDSDKALTVEINKGNSGKGPFYNVETKTWDDDVDKTKIETAGHLKYTPSKLPGDGVVKVSIASYTVGTGSPTLEDVWSDVDVTPTVPISVTGPVTVNVILDSTNPYKAGSTISLSGTTKSGALVAGTDKASVTLDYVPTGTYDVMLDGTKVATATVSNDTGTTVNVHYYTYTFYPNLGTDTTHGITGGMPTPTTDVVLSGTTVTGITAPVRPGYEFKGWGASASDTSGWNTSTRQITGTSNFYATWAENKITVTVYKNGGPNTDKNFVLVSGSTVLDGTRGGASNNVITFNAVPTGTYTIELDGGTSHTATGHSVTVDEGDPVNQDLHYYDVEVAVPVVTGSSTAVTGGKSWIGTDTNETTSNANKATIELLVDGTEKEANIGASITDPNYDFKTWSQEPSGGSFSDATSANDGKFTITSKNTTIKGPIVLTPEYQKSRYDVTITVNVDGVPTNGLTVELYDSAGTTLVDSQATAGSGVAAFHGRSNGTYTIKVKDGTTTYPGTESVTVKSDDAKKTVNAYSYIFVTNEPEAATQSASSMPTPFVSQKNNVTTAIDRTSAVVVLSTYTGVSATAPGLKGYGFSGWGVNDKNATTDLWDGSNRSLTTQTTFYAIWGADTVGLTDITAKGALNLAGIIEQTGGAASGGGGGGTASNYTYEVVSTEGLANDGDAHGITVTPLTDGSGSFTVSGTPDAVGDIKFTIKATSKLNGQSATATLTVTVERTYTVEYAAPGATLDPAHNVLPDDSRVYTESGKQYGSTRTYSTITADTSDEPQWNNGAKGLLGWALTNGGTQEATFAVSTAKAHAAANGVITLYAVWSDGKLSMKNATLTAEYNMLKSQWDANKSGLCSASSIDLTTLQVGGTDVAHWTFTVTDLPSFMVFDGAHTISMRPDDDATGNPKRVGDVVTGGYKIKVKLVDSGLENAEATGTITLNVLKTTPVIVGLADKGGTHYAGDPTMDAMTYTKVVDPFETTKILSDDRDADIARWTVDDTTLDATTKTYNFTYTHVGTDAGNYNAATGPLELTAENRVISMTTGTKGDEDHYVKDYIDNTHFTTTQTYNPATNELTVTVGVKNTSATSNIDTLTVTKTSGNAAVFSNPTSLLTSNNLNLAPNGVNNSVFTFKVQLGKTAVGEYEAKYTLTGKAGGTTSPATATATYTYKLKIGPALLDHATIAGLKVPTTGGTPTKLAGLSKTDSNKDLYTIESLTWAANDATFGAGKSYTATIVLKANPNYLFTVPNSKGETDCGGYQVTDDHATTTATLTGAATGNGTLSYGPDMASANSETVTLTYVFDPTASSGPVPVLTEKNYTTATLDKITATSTVPVDFYYVITDSAKKPSAADIIAGTGAVADATNASGKVTSGAANKGTVTWNAGITVTGLTPGTRYYVHVVACRAGTTSSPSPVGSDDALIPKYLKVNLHTGETAGTTSTVTASGTVLGGTTPVATPLNKDKDTTGALSMTGNGAFNPAPDIPTNELNNNTAWVFREVTVSTADDLPETGVTPGTAASTDPYTYNHGSAKAVTVVDITFRQRITGMPVVDTTSQAGHLVVTAGSTKIGDTTVTDAMLSSGKTGLTGATTTAGTDLEYVWEYKAVGASNWTALEAAYNPTTYNPTLPTDAAHAGAQYRVTVIYTGDDSLAGIHSSVQTGESGMTVELQRYQAANTVTYGTGVNRTPDEKGGGYYDASTSDTAKQMRMEGLKVIIRYTGAVTRTDEYVVGKDTLPEGLVWKGTGTVTVPANLTNFDIDFPSSGSTKISFTYGGQTSNTVDFRMNPKPLYYHTTDAAKLWDNSNNLGTNLLAPRVELNEGQIYVTDTTKGTDDVSLTGLTASDFQLSSSNVGVDYDVDIAPGSRSKLKLTGKQAGFYTLAPGYDTLCTTKGKGYITPRRVEVAQIRISGVEAGKDIAAAKASVTATDGLNGNHNKLTGNYPITWEILKDGGIPTNEDDWIRPEDDGNYNGKFQSNRQYRPTVQITADANHYLELNDNYVIRNLENNAWLKNGDPNTVVTVDSTGPNHPGLTEKLGHDVLYNNPGTFQTVYDLTITPELRFEDFGPNGHHHEPKTNLVHIEVVDQGASLGQYTVELGAYILSVWDVTMGTPSGDLIDMGATLTPEDRTGAHELTVDPDDKIRYTLDLSGVSTATAGTYMLTLTAKGSAEEGTLANDVQASYTFALVVDEPRVEPQPQPPSVEQSIIVLYWVSLKGKTNDLTGEKIPASGGRPTFVPKIIGLDGWVFKGWAETDPTLLKDGEKPELVDPLKIKLTSDKIYYAYYEKEEVDHVHFVRGYPDGTFRPDNYITRAEVATIIARSCLEGFEEGKDYGNPGGYSDIGTKRWYTSAISYCSMAGVFTGYPDGTFRPNDYITRQELALVVGRLAGLRVNMGLPFEDASSVNKWARDGVYTCYILGYVGGYNDGTFRPKNDITRAETVKIFNGYLNRGVDAKGLEGMTPFQLDASAGSYQINGTTEYLTWQDVPEKHWAYYEIIEASNDHDFHWPEDENDTSKKEAPPEDWDAVYIEAEWRYRATYAITWSVSEGTVAETTTKVALDKAPVAPEVTADEGRVFLGWALTEGGEVVDLTTIAITGAQTFYGIFADDGALTEPKTFTVSFETGEWADLDGESSIPVEENGVLTTVPAAIAHEGYLFHGWSLTIGGEVIDPTTVIVTEDMTFFVVCEEKPAEPKSLTVTFLSGEQGDLTGETALTVEEGTFLTELPVVTAREGYVFAGWALTEGGAAVDPTQFAILEDTVFYALYTEQTQPEPEPEIPGTLYTIKAYIDGYEDGTFRPKEHITRATVASMIARAYGSDFDETFDYDLSAVSDITPDHWAAKAIGYCLEKGYFSGYPDGTFAPDGTMTRQEFAVVIAKLAGVQENQGLPFTDADSINKWARNYVYTVYVNGWITGYNDGTFKPKNLITRAEAVKIFNAFLGRSTTKESFGQVTEFDHVWSDFSSRNWAYPDIMEATNDHTYYLNEEGVAIWVDPSVAEAMTPEETQNPEVIQNPEEVQNSEENQNPEETQSPEEIQSPEEG